MSTTPSDPFLPSVPEGWTINRFGRDIQISEGQVDPREEPWASTILIAPNHIESGTGRLLEMQTAADQGADSGKYLAKKGQVLYSKIRPALNKVAIAPVDCLCSADMYAIEGRNGVDARYLSYYLRSQPFHAYASVTADRVKMPKINREELAAAPWARPPIVEQRAIAEFLDDQTAQIDKLISKQTELITTLRERWGVVLENATTHGIDPSAPLKESGIAWAPRIPTGWEAGRLKWDADLTAGGTPDTSVDEYWLAGDDDSGIPWVAIGDMSRRSTVTTTAKSLSPDGAASRRLTIGEPGTVLLAMYASVGEVAELGIRATWNQALLGINPGRKLDSAFIRYALLAMRQTLLADVRSNTQSNLNASQVGDLWYPRPPFPEQRQIVTYLDERAAKIDALIVKTEQHIDLASERRAALIAAAVTGQIDARTAARATEGAA